MAQSLLDRKLEYWKNRLLDVGKRNRMIHYRPTRRSTLALEAPDCLTLYHRLAVEEGVLSFQRPVDADTDRRTWAVLSLMEQLASPVPVFLGDIRTGQVYAEQQKTLKAMRAKSRLALEEQGTNILYLSFGFLEWKDGRNGSGQTLRSPLILVPVTLGLASVHAPYTLKKYEEDITLNPTLAYYFETELGITLPPFDPAKQEPEEYFTALEAMADEKGWQVIREANLGLLSFLKITMYRDLEANEQCIRENPVIRSLVGEPEPVPQVPLEHDAVAPRDCYQVLSADSSQQDALAYARAGVSFVMEGPPGSGKSQTITNIIAEALAAGKKVLFVSEKMAALQVVYRRLQEVHLGEFCLPLHSYKANKKDILEQIGANLNMKQTRVKDAALRDLDELEQLRRGLNDYAAAMHRRRGLLDMSCYQVIGALQELPGTGLVCVVVADPMNVSPTALNHRLALLDRVEQTVRNLGCAPTEDPWNGIALRAVTYEFRLEMERRLEGARKVLESAAQALEELRSEYDFREKVNFTTAGSLGDALTALGALSGVDVPERWLTDGDLDHTEKLLRELESFVPQWTDLRNRILRVHTQIPFAATNDPFDALIRMEEMIHKLEALGFRATDPAAWADASPKWEEDCRELEKALSEMEEALLRLNMLLAAKLPERAETVNKLERLSEALEAGTPLMPGMYRMDDADPAALLESARDHRTRLEVLEPRLRAAAGDGGLSLTRETLESSGQYAAGMRRINQILGTCFAERIGEKEQAAALIRCISTCGRILSCWFLPEGENAGVLEEAEKKAEELRVLEAEILKDWKKEIFVIDYAPLLLRYQTEYTGFLRGLKPTYHADRRVLLALSRNGDGKLEDAAAMALLRSLEQRQRLREWFREREQSLEDLCGEGYRAEQTDFAWARRGIAAAGELRSLLNGRVPQKLKDMLAREDRGEAMKELEDAASELEKAARKLSGTLPDDLEACREELLERLDILEFFTRNESALRTYCACDPLTGSVDWEQRILDLRRGRQIAEIFEGRVPALVQQTLMRPNYSRFARDLNTRRADLEEKRDRIALLLKGLVPERDFEDYGSVKRWASEAKESLRQLTLLRSEVRDALRSDGNTAQAIAVYPLRKQFAWVHNRCCEITLEKDYGLPGGWHWEDLDYPALYSALEAARMARSHGLGVDFMTGFAMDEELRCRVSRLGADLKAMAQGDARWLMERFTPEAGLEKLEPDALLTRLAGCRPDTLEAWMDYQELRRQCAQMDLSDYLTALEQRGDYRDAGTGYLRSFYISWLDVVFAGDDALRRFRKTLHESYVNQFGQLDDRQLAIAQMRIREMLSAAMPQEQQFLRATDEQAILKKELGKKRNIMPLRKLFRSIPNLLLELKPCLMMSPLSVSYFLEAETYHFDLVIFDEASQIFPEDAIGAIFRGSQVIIAGDSRQLPPTNFFAATTGASEGDYDVDDDEEEWTVTDSILEEAAQSLPNQMLRWHYRSRHEHLIAFSNRMIYGNSLITFPGCNARSPDMGIEYIHVPDGVYERGGHNCNRREAQRCAELVLEHIRRHPERSLGVIAFSEKQQTAIEDAVTELREQNPALEQFFSEDSDEPFFVKNLENVQGDERDTIILSICYAKDANGRMHMNFGPLGKAGGERRLNVAITRAKLNVKLVGSILPEDIRLTEASSAGIRMLRGYVAFAHRGITALPPVDRETEEKEPDGFRERVAQVLEQQGYRVHRDLGCSDYRLDLAVEMPGKPGTYACAIECDGEVYVQAHTARDRDHLRTSILHRMGWNTLRVWSAAWMKEPKAEEEKLLSFVAECCGGLKPVPDEQEEDEADIADEVILRRKRGRKDNPYGFDYYREMMVSADFAGQGERRAAALIPQILRVEQPMHPELLCRRLAPVFGSGKVTENIRSRVERLLRTDLADRICRDGEGFLSLTGAEPVRVRIPRSDDTPRSLEHISREEIGLAMETIAGSAVGISRDDLSAECAMVFGYERRGPKIRKRMDDVIDYLVETGRMRILEDKVLIP